MCLSLMGSVDLSALSCTSKQHRCLVVPTLYRTVCWDYKEERTHPPAHLLLRSIINRPELASYVHCLALYCPTSWMPLNCGPSVWKKANKPDLTSTEMTGLTLLIKSFNFFDQNRWISSLELGEGELFVALLISQLSHLRHLHLNVENHHEDTYFFGAFLRKAPHALHVLEHVEYGSDLGEDLNDVGHQYNTDLNQIKPLFLISSLKSVRISLPHYGLSWGDSNVPISGLTKLDLHHSQLSEVNLGRLLLSTPSLKSFKYDAWIDVSDFEAEPPQKDWEYFNCAQLGRSLANVQRSLEQLKISLCFFSEEQRFFEPENETMKFRGIAGKLETLRYFKHLSSVSMPTVLLSDWTPELEVFRTLEELPPRVSDLLPMSSLADVYLSDYCDLYKVLQPNIDDEYSSDLSLVDDDEKDYDSWGEDNSGLDDSDLDDSDLGDSDLDEHDTIDSA